MKLKIDDSGNAVINNGQPVFIRDDGTEQAIDVPGLVKTISARNHEAKTFRERAEVAEEKLKGFEGIEDPVAAKKAMDLMASLDQKKLIDAGQVDIVKAEMNKAWEGKLAGSEKEKEQLRKQLIEEKIGGSFSRSKFITDKLTIPFDLVQARFGSHFKLEDGKIVAYSSDGSRIHSRSNPGETAGFDEALNILVDAYPSKDVLYKPDQLSGGGTPSDGGKGNFVDKKTIPIATFDKLSPKDQAAKMKDGFTPI